MGDRVQLTFTPTKWIQSLVVRIRDLDDQK